MAGEAPDETNNPSQEDVDAALRAAGAADTESTDEGPVADASGSNEDGAQPNAAAAGDAADSDASGGVTEGGLSAADVDAVVEAASDSEPASETAAPEGEASPQQGDASDPGKVEFTQDEIDAALAGGAAQPEGDAAVSSGAKPEAPQPEAGAGEAKLDSAGRPFDDAAAMMEAAIAEEKAAAADGDAAPGQPAPQGSAPLPENAVALDLPDFNRTAADAPDDKSIDLLNDVDLNVKIELGRTSMVVEEVLKLGEGSVVELDKLAGDPVDVLVNDRLVARGEVLVLNDNFCVRISEIVAGHEEATKPEPVSA